MKITEKQLLFLLDVLQDTLEIEGRPDIFSYNRETRIAMFDNIMNQQSDKIIEVTE